MPLRDSALLLLGHGSTLNADSSAPTYLHAEEIRRRRIFAEVHVAFWKEEPNFRQALRQTRCREIYVVPNFISSGYFTEQVIPRELGLTGPVTIRDRQQIHYCEPVGLHPQMTEALLQRALQVVADSLEKIAEPARTACVFICGHGTSFNDNSTKIIHEQAEIIRARGIYADCQPVLMEQKPFVKDWRTLTGCPDVIVVPFFISDGLHSFEDIPVLLGLTHNIKEQGFTNPHRENGRRLWYATAIGTEPFIADVIVAQVQQFASQAAAPSEETESIGETDSTKSPCAEIFTTARRPLQVGELVIRHDEGTYATMIHRDDEKSEEAALRALGGIEDLREMIRLDRAGNFRPLRAAPNLQRGWIYRAPNLSDLALALDYIYPACRPNWELWNKNALVSTSWNETAQRQTGRFRIVRELDEFALQELVAQTCEHGCLKRRLWSPASQTVGAGLGEIPLLCPEACNYLVGKAREKLKGPGEE